MPVTVNRSSLAYSVHITVKQLRALAKERPQVRDFLPGTTSAVEVRAESRDVVRLVVTQVATPEQVQLLAPQLVAAMERERQAEVDKVGGEVA